jgi:hypothetical protein
MKVYLYQKDGRSKFYGSISALCLDLGLSVHTLYKHDFKLPYLGKDFQIEMGPVLTIGDVKKTKLPEIKKSELKLHEPTKQTNLKINILPGNYIKKDQYYFNVDGEIFDEKQFFSRYGKKYSYPTKIIGEIKNLLLTKK